MSLSPPAQPGNAGLRWKVAIWSLAALCAYAAFCLFLKSRLSFDDLRAIALSAVPPGYNDRFTIDLYLRITSGLRVMAYLLVVLSLILVLFARSLSRFLFHASRQVALVVDFVVSRMAALKRDRLHAIVLLLIFIAGISFRLAFLREPIRNDESYTFMYYASRPLYIALTYYTVNNHMLNTLLMHVATSIFGASVWAVRLPTLIAGVLIIPATYAVTRAYHGKNVALVAVALVSASSPLIEYSFNARGYSLGTILFLLMILSVALIEVPLAGAWYFVPLMASLAMYSVPTMIYGVGGVFLYCLLRRLDLRRTLLAMVCTGVLTFVFYSPVVFTVGLSAVTSNRWVVPVPRTIWLAQFRRELNSLWIYWNLDLPHLLSILLVVGILIALFTPREILRPPVAPLLCVIVVAAVFLPIQRLVPFRRTWLFLLPLFFASAALGINLVLRKLRHSELLSAAVALLITTWMGGTVLTAKSLRNSGIEAAGGHASETIVLAMKDRLLRGDQFICTDSFDSPLDFEMYLHKIPYQPSPDGDLLIVTPRGQSPERTLSIAGISRNDLLSLRKLGDYGDQAVYLGVRGPKLPFEPGGSTWMGEFKSTSQ